MTRPKRCGCALLVALFALACSDDPAPLTQIVVVVDSDYSVPSELDTLEISVTGAVDMPRATADLKQQKLPRSLGLVHSGGELGPVRVKVSGRLGNEPVVVRDAVVSFSRSKTLELRMPLTRACRVGAAASCSNEQTCDDGKCVPAAQTKLPAFSGKAQPFVTSAGTGVPAAGRNGSAGMGMGMGGAGVGSAGRGGVAGMPAAGTSAGDTGSAGQAAGTGGTGGLAGAGSTNQKPECSITHPSAADSFMQGDAVLMMGSCTDPERGNLILGLHWDSNLDGLLGVGGNVTRANLSLGEHTLSLCAPDPDDAQLEGCATVMISVAPLPPITAMISSLMQGSTSTSPFKTMPAINAMGSGGGADPVTLAWMDSMLGSLGSNATATLSTPLVGKHFLQLTATDARQRTATDSRSFTVLATGKSNLIEQYALLNAAVGTGKVEALAADAQNVYAGATPGVLYSVPASDPASAPTIVETPAPSQVRDVFLHEASGNAYIALDSGFKVCKYAANSGIDEGMCTLYKDLVNMPSNDVTAILRYTINSNDVLVAGTKNGLFVAKEAGDPSKGGEKLPTMPAAQAAPTAAITGLALANGNTALWIATSNGMFGCDQASATPLNCAYRRLPETGSPGSAFTDVAVGTGNAVWVSSNNGIGRFLPSNNTWTTWRAATVSGANTPPSLANNDVRDVAVARSVNVGGMAHDVIWFATASGVTRFDPLLQSFTNFVSSDGLPGNDVWAVIVLANGDKVIGGDKGAALYRGL